MHQSILNGNLPRLCAQDFITKLLFWTRICLLIRNITPVPPHLKPEALPYLLNNQVPFSECFDSEHFTFFLSLYAQYFVERNYYAQPIVKSGELCYSFLQEQYLHKSFGILLYKRFGYSPLFIHLIIHSCTY